MKTEKHKFEHIAIFLILLFLLIPVLYNCGSSTSGSGNDTTTESPKNDYPICNATTVNCENCEQLAFQHLEYVMDKFHNSFDVYTDQNSGGNHGYPTGWMGDISALQLNTEWIDNCYNGNTCIRNVWTPRSATWAGIMWQEPEDNWGKVENGGYNIVGATRISFWARGENGGEQVDFIVGGITGDYPDSIQPTIHTGVINLTKEWKEYTIDLTGKDLTNVIGLFGWITSIDPIFYLDDIKYDKARLDDLRFLQSYETLSSTDPDKYIRNASFIYENALALIAFLSRGTEDDIKRAKILADAFVFAQNNDREYSDGRLRNAYMSGDLIDHQTGKARLPGWWDSEEEKWYEDKYQVSSYTGNMAWVIIALLNYYHAYGGSDYLQASIRLGDWIYNNTYDTKGPGGYTGGYDGWEPIPTKITWKSTEHNIDVYVAFAKLYEETGDAKWITRSLSAKHFVEAMWDEPAGHFWTGTIDDGVTINRWTIPLDVNTGGLMALGHISKYGRGINWVDNKDNCYVEADGFKGFDFDTDRDHVWFEGTAQMVLAYSLIGNGACASTYLSELDRAQREAPNANSKGIVAASHDGLTTGFDWLYYSRLHVGATAWFIFAERGYNPYWGISITDPIPDYNDGSNSHTITVSKEGTGTGTITSIPSGINCGSDCSESYSSGVSVTLTATADAASTFSSWSGCDSTSGYICYVTMNASKTVIANFTANPMNYYDLTVTKSGEGSGTVTSNPSGINCGGDCSESYSSGVSVTLTATADTGSTFSGWSGCDSTSGTICHVTMTVNKIITAIFTITPVNYYNLTVTKSGGGNGTVTSNPLGINCGSDCSESYSSGVSVTLTATADTGSTFSGWSGCDSTSGTICYVNMTVNKIVTANFAVNPIEVTYTYSDFTLVNVCTYDNNWCGYADRPGKAVIYGEMSKTIDIPNLSFKKLDVTISIPCNGWGEGLAGPDGSSAQIIVDDVIKEEKIDSTMPYHHGGYYKYEYCESFSNTFDIESKTQILLIIRMTGGARLDFQKAKLRFY